MTETMQPENPLDELIDALVTGVITPEQRRALHQRMADPLQAELVKDRITQALTADQTNHFHDQAIESWLESRILSGVSSKIHKTSIVTLKRQSIYRRLKWAAAAVVTGVLILLYLESSKELQAPGAPLGADVAAPTGNRATLQLANGKTIYLDQLRNGQTTSEGDVQIVKLNDGQIVYSGSSSETKYHTLVNPKGSTVIDMAFADGSHLWLNAGSSVRYPLSFSGKTREVFITGEAFFEVKHNAAMPFVVHAGGQTIEDLGTSFNVNSYDNEGAVKITLVEGEVKIGAVQLKPGEQFDEHRVVKADLEEVLAWKNNEFVYHGASTEVVMRQFERWYDIEVKYLGAVPEHSFRGSVPREYALSEALNVLEASGVKFKIEGKQLIVQP